MFSVYISEYIYNTMYYNNAINNMILILNVNNAHIFLTN